MEFMVRNFLLRRTSIRASAARQTALARWALLAAALILALVGSARAQSPCTGEWSAANHVPGVDGVVICMTMWDRDGPGPLPPLVVVGGDFRIAGDAVAASLAAWDPATGHWSVLGQGPGLNSVSAVAVLQSGELVVAGVNAPPGGSVTFKVLRWNGSTWTSLGSNPDGNVNTLIRLANGDLVAGGNFTSIGGVAANRIARWNGSSWSAMGSGMDSNVTSVVQRPNGDVVVAGAFNLAGGVSAPGVARWTGSAWVSMTGTLWHAWGPRLTALPNGDMVAVGNFSGGQSTTDRIMRWNGNDWVRFEGIPLQDVSQAQVLADGTLVVAGHLFSGQSTMRLARWNGTAWTMLVSTNGGASEVVGTIDGIVELPGGQLIASGGIIKVGARDARAMARWTGSEWMPVDGGLNNTVTAIGVMPNGDLVVGKKAEIWSNMRGHSVLRWNGMEWRALGVPPNGDVAALAVMPNGDVMVAGQFWETPEVPAHNLARWNGAAWSVVSPSPGEIKAMAVAPNGDLVVCGSLYVGAISGLLAARWTGSEWLPIGGNSSGGGTTIAVLPNGDVAVAGSFLVPNGPSYTQVMLWDGTSWRGLGATFGGSTLNHSHLLVTPTGELIAAGTTGFISDYTSYTGRVARWDGQSWQALGGALGSGVGRIGLLPSGELVCTRAMPPSSPRQGAVLARWNESAWIEVANIYGDEFGAIKVIPGGDVLVGGRFYDAGGVASAHLARWTPPTPPQITVQPADTFACGTMPAEFRVVGVEPNGQPLTYQWRRNGVPVSASTNPTAALQTLRFNKTSFADAGTYDCIVSNSCRSVIGSRAQLVVACPSLANVARLGASPGCDGQLTSDDITLFLQRFFLNDLSVADVAGIGGGAGADGRLTVDDIVAFLSAFFAGCN